MASINGNAYSYANIRFNFFGREFNAVRAINYSEKQDKKPVYGAGEKPIGKTKGTKEYKGDITLPRHTLDAIQASLPAGTSITDIKEFDITVAFLNDNQVMTTHRLIGCEFMNNGVDGKTGSADVLDQKIDLYISDINWNF